MKRAESVVDLKSLFGEGAGGVTLAQAVETFLRVEKSESSWSRQTEAWYRDRLGLLVLDLGPERAVGELMEGDLAEWRVRISERDSRYGVSRPEVAGGLSPFTLHGHVRACKRFFGWLFKSGILPVHLARNLKLPKLPRQQRKGISDENALAILEAARGSVRDYAILTFVESTGVRRGGVEHLQLQDLSLDSPVKRLQRRAIVREKGEKERPVVMSEEAQRAMKDWLAIRPEVLDERGQPEERVFLGQSPGQAWHALSAVGLSEIFDRYKKQLALRGPCSPHQWRHRWCRRMLQNGMPISQVSQLAGHSDISVTHNFYGGFSIDQLQESYERFYKSNPQD